MWNIFIGLGANLPHPEHGAPAETLLAALDRLTGAGIEVRGRSPFYESAPQPASDQPWYVNCAAELDTGLSPHELLALLNQVEADFGRVRAKPNAARAIDLDLLDYQGLVMDTPRLTLPHPRAHLRDFVLFPLRDIAPGWRHPVTGAGIEALIASLPGGAADIRRLRDKQVGNRKG